MPDDATPQPDASSWHPLPGGVLEFAATGFAIELTANPNLPPFLGIDPEGRYIVAGVNLDAVKAFVQTIAAWRREFHPPTGGWIRVDLLPKRTGDIPP